MRRKQEACVSWKHATTQAVSNMSSNSRDKACVNNAVIRAVSACDVAKTAQCVLHALLGVCNGCTPPQHHVLAICVKSKVLLVKNANADTVVLQKCGLGAMDAQMV